MNEQMNEEYNPFSCAIHKPLFKTNATFSIMVIMQVLMTGFQTSFLTKCLYYLLNSSKILSGGQLNNSNFNTSSLSLHIIAKFLGNIRHWFLEDLY